ncbi:MAG TPA: diacylglycerol kinase family protein [Actinophytocola sp.]|uniref:diacylglycerol/lipid kinase family protein n=1 Tax=Actinophytocola sp. TaxID=1872138 RepID=UPI002DDCADCD|nr:diacylglycerol kinase family protein [Actinophytocola sp.]HEV2783532.1 diacylglycerol kinase family protein [Actinophytocola sp.]
MGIRAALAVHGPARRVANEVADRLRAAVDHLELVEAGTVEEARALMVRARDGAGLDVLIVLGGDGSAHQGVQFCAGTDAALGVIPAGTGNDLVRALGQPMETLAATDAMVAALGSGRRRKLDLGRVGGDMWFATVLCAGFDSAVNERANRMRWPRGHRRYDLATVVELAALRPYPLVVRAGAERLELEATMVSVGNTPYYGGGIPICPDADPTDGLFDVTVVGPVSRLELLRMVPTLRSGRHTDHPAITMLRADSVRLGEDNGWIAYADGERIRPLPVDVSCTRGALTIVG